MDFKSKRSFEKAFKQSIPNFDETKMHFIYGNRLHNGVDIKFVLDGKLKTLKMYLSQYDIDRWKNHFIEYFNTGEFDYNQYWIPYADKKPIEEKYLVPRKIPLVSKFGNDFYDHSSKELDDYMREIRQIYPNCGFKIIGK